MSFPHLFIISLQDTLKPSVLWVTLFSLFATVCVFIVAIWLVFGGLESLSVIITQWAQNFESSLEKNWLVSLLSLVVVAKTLMMILFFVSSAMVTYYLFLMVYSIIVGFFAGYFIKEIAQKYYPHTTLKGIPLPSYIWLLLKFVAITILLFILFSPLLFVPLLNFMFLIPVFYLFHKLLVLEVSSVVCSRKEYQELQKNYGDQSRIVSALCFALTFIPIIGVMIYPYYVIVMSHFVLGKTQTLRHVHQHQHQPTHLIENQHA